jgi:V/A-type H+-transporting ATPase subunit I
MLRPTRMKKLQIVALEGFRDGIVKGLQALGTVHLTDYSEVINDPHLKDLLQPHPTSPNIRRIAAQTIALNRLLDVFERHDPEPREGFIKAVFAPMQPKKLETEELSGPKLLDVADEVIAEVDSEVAQPVQDLEGIDEEIAEHGKIRGLLELVVALDIDLGDVGDWGFTSVLLGVAPKQELDNLRARLEDITDNVFYLGASETSEDRIVTVVVCLKKQAAAVLANLRRLNWERVEIQGLQGTPSQAIASIDKRLEDLDQEKRAQQRMIVDIARRRKDELRKYRELLMVERQREENHTKFARMEHVVVIEGWVPSESVAQAVQEITSITSGACVLDLTEPDANDDVPVQLKNPRFFKSFELLTRLYGLPTYDGVDPTLFLAPGFLLFFSIMLTDAMYGLIALVLGMLLIRGGGKYNEMIKDGGIILSSAGVATIIIGALSGGWFGGFGLKLPVLASLQVFDPMVQVTAFLLIALTIGLAHVNVGVIINVVHKLKAGQRWRAITENLWFLFAQAGLIFIVSGHKSLGLVFIVIALILLLGGHKAMSMFQVTGFMGDILSYARLMALGLCTTGIAMTVNVLAGMLYMVGWLGIVLAVIIFLFGHVFNFLINAMGSFVHGLRLHYVEFFTKFYQSGGTEFAPLEMKFDTIEIK